MVRTIELQRDLLLANAGAAAAAGGRVVARAGGGAGAAAFALAGLRPRVHSRRLLVASMPFSSRHGAKRNMAIPGAGSR